MLKNYLGSRHEAPGNLSHAGLVWAVPSCASQPIGPNPVLGSIGGRNSQIDVRADSNPLHKADARVTGMTFGFPPNANHRFQQDAHTPAEVTARPRNGWTRRGARPVAKILQALLKWLHTAMGHPGSLS